MVIKSSFSKRMLLSTTVFCVMFGFALAYMFLQLTNEKQTSSVRVIIFLAFVLVCCSIVHAFCSQIKNVQIDNEYLVVKKMCGKLVIPISEISEVGRKKKLMYDIRLFGIGGLFGYIGLFRGNDIGRYCAYVNNGNNAFYIKKSDGKCYVVSCNQVDQVLSLLNNLIDNR